MKLKNVKISIQIEEIEIQKEYPITDPIIDPITNPVNVSSLRDRYVIKLGIENVPQILKMPTCAFFSEQEMEKRLKIVEKPLLIYFQELLKDYFINNEVASEKSKYNCLWVKIPYSYWRSYRSLDEIHEMLLTDFVKDI